MVVEDEIEGFSRDARLETDNTNKTKLIMTATHVLVQFNCKYFLVATTFPHPPGPVPLQESRPLSPCQDARIHRICCCT